MLVAFGLCVCYFCSREWWHDDGRLEENREVCRKRRNRQFHSCLNDNGGEKAMKLTESACNDRGSLCSVSFFVVDGDIWKEESKIIC